MAASVASLLAESIKKSDLFNKLASQPGVKAAKASAAGAGKAGSMVAGQLGPGGGPAGLAGGAIASKAMTGMAGMVKDILPSIGKLASPTQLLGLPGKLLSKGMGLMGINLSLSTLLRQSQLFTGILGALFQILGGFVDVVLAPFMPFFVNIIRKLADQIPKVREWAQKIYGWLETYVFPLIRKGFDWIWDKIGTAVEWFEENMPEIKEKVLGFWKEHLKPAIDTFWENIQGLWEWVKTNVWPTLVAAWDLFKGLWSTLWTFLKEEAWPILKTIFDRVANILAVSLAWLRDDIFPLIQQIWDWLIKEVGGFVLWLADNVTAWLERVVPKIESIVTQVIDILINSIAKPLWDSLEPVLKWYVEELLKQWEWVIGVYSDTILPFIKDVIDDLMPHVQELSEFFMENVAPHITEFYEAMREFVDAFLDVALPILKWVLNLLWIVLKPILKLIFKLVGFVFRILGWVLKGLTWLLRLPFMWRQQVLDPILSNFDEVMDMFKKGWTWVLNFRDMLKVAILGSLASFLQKIGGQGKIDIPFAPDIPLGWMQGLGNRIMGVANDMQEGINKSNEQLNMGLSTTTGGMRAKYGTSPVEVNINNYTSTGVMDSTRNMVIDGENQRSIDNMIEQESSLGAYSSLDNSLKAA